MASIQLSEALWADVRQELKDADKAIFSELDSDIPGEVTHYTSLASLEGILSKQEIWCTDLRQVNDDRECDYGMDIIRSVVVNKSVPARIKDTILRQKRLFGAKQRFTLFISCFCSSPDTPEMWNDYAEQGQGAAIVFDAQALTDGSNSGEAYSFAPMIYDKKIQYEKTRRVVDTAIQIQRRRELPAEEYWVHAAVFQLFVCGVRFKTPKWREEREIRIALVSSDDLKIFSHGGKDRVAVPFERPAVRRIILGPNAKPDAREHVQELLSRAGFAADLIMQSPALC